jgi:hypothetical protein
MMNADQGVPQVLKDGQFPVQIWTETDYYREKPTKVYKRLQNSSKPSYHGNMMFYDSGNKKHMDLFSSKDGKLVNASGILAVIDHKQLRTHRYSEVFDDFM